MANSALFPAIVEFNDVNSVTFANKSACQTLQVEPFQSKVTMSAESSKNILLIFTDQLRADCISALGNSNIKTPNIDRLVHEGTTFDRCYTPSPVCVPARHSLTSGLPPHITGCVDNVDIESGDPSLMERLVEKGYQAHGTGKMHFSKKLGDWGFTSRDVTQINQWHILLSGICIEYVDKLYG